MPEEPIGSATAVAPAPAESAPAGPAPTTPAEATPATAAGAAAPPGDGQPPAGPSAEPGQATAGREEERVKGFQRLMTRATQEAAELRRTLTGLGYTFGPDGKPSPPAQPAQPVAAQPAATAQPQPPAPPTEASAPAEQPAVDPEWVENLWTQYSNAGLDEKAAFSLFVGELGKAMVEHVNARLDDMRNSLTNDPRVAEAFHGQFQAREAQARRVESVVKEVEGYWQRSAPQIHPRFIWPYAADAERAHPNDVIAQAKYCLERAATDLGPLVENIRANENVNAGLERGQLGVVPGGGFGPPAGGGGENLPTMADQLRALRSRQG